MTLEPAARQSRVKHSTTEPLPSLQHILIQCKTKYGLIYLMIHLSSVQKQFKQTGIAASAKRQELCQTDLCPENFEPMWTKCGLINLMIHTKVQADLA